MVIWAADWNQAINTFCDMQLALEKVMKAEIASLG